MSGEIASSFTVALIGVSFVASPSYPTCSTRRYNRRATPAL